MSNLALQNIEGEKRIDSRLLEKRLDIDHVLFYQKLSKYFDELQLFGSLRFQIEVINDRGQLEKFFYLNEDQAIFVLSLFRNTKQVVDLNFDLTTTFLPSFYSGKSTYC